MLVKPMRVRASALCLCVTLALFASACSPHFDQQAYENATALKVDSRKVMSAATQPYAQHQSEADELMNRVDKAYEYANGLPKNQLSARQWSIMRDPGRNLLGGFMKRWRERSTLGQAFVDEMIGQVSDAYDQIIGLESGKIKPAEAKVIGG